MTGLATLSNFLAFNAQVIAIVIAAAVLLRVLTFPTAGARYAAWRLALALCLLTPWLLRSAPAPAVVVPPPAIVTDAVLLPDTTLALSSNSQAPAVRVWPSLPWTSIAVSVLAAGVVLRALWLAAGLWRLRVLRRQALRADDELSDEVQTALGTRAAIASVPELTQPVTFGVWRPVVLLPEGIVGSPVEMRRAVLTHELLHVQRRDWCWIVAEELLRTALWFQPAIWWATSRIQLAREQVVDELTVLATGNRRGYIEALLAFADGAQTRPAPAFSRRTHLFARIVGLSKEHVMSSSRIVASASAVVMALVASAWAAGTVFPVLAAAPAIVAPAAARPVAASDSSVFADVVVTPAQDEPRVIAAPIGAQKRIVAELQAMTTRPDAERSPVQAGRPRTPGGLVIATQTDFQRALQVGTSAPGVILPRPQEPGNPITPENPIPRRLSSVPVRYPDALRESGYRGTLVLHIVVDASGAVSDVRRVTLSMNSNLAPEALDALRTVTNEAVESVRLWRYQPPAEPPVAFFVTFSFTGGPDLVVSQSETTVNGLRTPEQIGAANLALAQASVEKMRALDQEMAQRYDEQHPDRVRLRAQIAALEAAMNSAKTALGASSVSATTGPGSTGGVQPMRVGGTLRPPTKTKHVAPAYPAVAMEARIQGVVILEVVIDQQGRVAEARVLRSIPMLDQAALDAITQWEFSPSTLDGQAVPVVMTVTMQFSLN